MKTRLQSILLLRDDKQQVVTNDYPYLHVDRFALFDVVIMGTFLPDRFTLQNIILYL